MEIESEFTSKTYYEILGISKNASDKEIKEAFHKLAKKYHPDNQDGNEEYFKRIKFGYDTLSDPIRRRNYDRSIEIGYSYTSYDVSEDFDHLYENVFMDTVAKFILNMDKKGYQDISINSIVNSFKKRFYGINPSYEEIVESYLKVGRKYIYPQRLNVFNEIIGEYKEEILKDYENNMITELLSIIRTIEKSGFTEAQIAFFEYSIRYMGTPRPSILLSLITMFSKKGVEFFSRVGDTDIHNTSYSSIAKIQEENEKYECQLKKMKKANHH